MSDSKKNENLNEGYSPKSTITISNSDKFGYQPAKSSGSNLSNSSQQTVTPPKKP